MQTEEQVADERQKEVLHLQEQELGAVAAVLALLEVVEVVELPVPLAPARDVRP